MTDRLAVIGLGNMGGGMARRLLETGHALTVHNRTADKAAPLVALGARAEATPAEAARGAELLLLSLADEQAVEEVLFGQLVPELDPGTVVVDTSTVSPGYARAAASRLAALGLHRVEACVVGNPLQARAGELRIYTAGEESTVQRVGALLDDLGSEVVHMGAPGSATTLKLILNLMLGAQVAALSEAVAYGVRDGMERDRLLEIVAGTGFSSPVLRFRAGLMRSGSFEPAFFRSALMAKDLRIALATAQDAGAGLPVLEAVRERFEAVVAAGDGDKDAAVLIDHAVGADTTGEADSPVPSGPRRRTA
ncbi:3-hydroxyisobutyrate dehydrogenase-like beta-hydroxyacid dehydrogenase [Streptomyces sp. V3I8]|uniref:NAD(P)-dependent oxidoreductase n=1 Tax=Streptomyces sp. V3I8 TaxID=3042279 RepID=UPI002786C86F|nr:NAD(P)-dependent oxidoreductase [Streptomyces sp. V3I8]MDQ1041665.1 3-hydroxyisobutyrate dehydrogenase-like beta-hydroxyacid dehydrogenase [Streptomyces sp. V3I8]